MAQAADWQIQALVKYLHEQFPGMGVTHSPRGRVAELFQVTDRGQIAHQLYLTKKFLDRADDGQTLVESLAAMGVIGRMRNAGSITVEVH